MFLGFVILKTLELDGLALGEKCGNLRWGEGFKKGRLGKMSKDGETHAWMFAFMNPGFTMGLEIGGLN